MAEAGAAGAARNAVQHLRLEASDYDAFMALPDDKRRSAYEELTRAARSTLHAPLKGVNAQKRERLRNMKVLILDNSQREPSVASVWGHPGSARGRRQGRVYKSGGTGSPPPARHGRANARDGRLREGRGYRRARRAADAG